MNLRVFVGSLIGNAEKQNLNKMQKTPEQVNALEDAFQRNKFPSEEEKKELALAVDLTYTQVSVSMIFNLVLGVGWGL